MRWREGREGGGEVGEEGRERGGEGRGGEGRLRSGLEKVENSVVVMRRVRSGLQGVGEGSEEERGGEGRGGEGRGGRGEGEGRGRGDNKLLTMGLDVQCLQGLFHLQTLILPHESIVDVHSHHSVCSESCIEERRAHCTVHPSTYQRLWDV